MPEKNVALCDGGSETGSAQTGARQGFPAACAGPRALCPGRGGRTKWSSPARATAGQRLNVKSPMRKCWRRPSGQDGELPKVGFAVLRSEEMLLGARIYFCGKRRTDTFCQGFCSIATRGKIPQSLPIVSISFLRRSLAAPSPGPGRGARGPCAPRLLRVRSSALPPPSFYVLPPPRVLADRRPQALEVLGG